MSSLVRRIQKGIARGQGFYRGADGLIHNSKDEPVGKLWPQVSFPTRNKEG